MTDATETEATANRPSTDASQAAVTTQQECTCWFLPQEGGGHIPAAALHGELEVMVRSRGAAELTGRPAGTCWAGFAGARERYLLLTVDDAGTVAFPESALLTVTPCGLETPADLRGPVQDLGRFARDESPWTAYVVTDDLEDRCAVEVTVRLIPHVCEPGRDPRDAADD